MNPTALWILWPAFTPMPPIQLHPCMRGEVQIGIVSTASRYVRVCSDNKLWQVGPGRSLTWEEINGLCDGSNICSARTTP